MQVTNTTQNQNTQIKKNMNTQQLTLSQQEIMLVKEFLDKVGSLDRAIAMNSEEIALLRADPVKSKKKVMSDEEKAEKLRIKEEKEATKEVKKLATAKAKEEKKLATAKAKEEKKLAASKAKEEKALAASKAKEEKALAKEQKLAAKKAKEANAGPKIDSSYTKKIFVEFADQNENKTDHGMKGINRKTLRIARKKDGSDPMVYRHNPNNWSPEATLVFESLTDKWNKKERNFSPGYKAPVKKSSVMAAKIAVEDTDEELDEEIPVGVKLYRKYLTSEKSGRTTWVQNGKSPGKDMISLDTWAYLESVKDEPFNNKTYDVNPELKTEEGVDMVDEQGQVVGNHVESFTPVEVEDKKVAAVEVAVEDKKVAAVEDEDEEEDQVSFENTLSEYDEDGFKSWTHWSQMGESLKLHKDNRVFLTDCPETEAFLGWYNEEKGEIESELDESDDEFGSDEEKDTELFD